MMTTSTAPFPYKTPYFTHLEADSSPERMTLFHTPDSLQPMRDFTFIDERELEKLLPKIESEVGRHGWNARFTLPARIEFIFNYGLEGMLLFDSRGRLIVHVTTAKLGYDGHGGMISKKVMRLVGVSEELIEQIWRATKGMSPYVIVISRELHTSEETGVPVAIRGLEVAPNWEWWSRG